MTLTVSTQNTASAQTDIDTQTEAATEDVAYFETLMNDSQSNQTTASSEEDMPAVMVQFVTDMTISNMSKNPFLKDIAKELENN